MIVIPDQIRTLAASNHLTDAKYIKGGYFVVKDTKARDALKIEKRNDDGTIVEDGTIVKGSICYCQEGDEAGKCFQYDGESWVEKNLIGGGNVDNGGDVENGDSTDSTEDEKPTENLSFEYLEGLGYIVSGVKYIDDTDGDGTQTDYTKVVIPATYKGEPVRWIDQHAFDGWSKLESVKIPNTITRISDRAFHNCTSLTSVLIPNSVIVLGGSPAEPNFPGGEAFKGCTNLAYVMIPKSVEWIGYHAFEGCEHVTIYYEGAEIPKGWYEDSYGDTWNPLDRPVVFNTYMDYINVSELVTFNEVTYSSSKGLLVRVGPDYCTIWGTGNCTDTNVVIPSMYKNRKVTSINDEAFQDNTKLKSVMIGRNVTYIDMHAFRRCINLERVIIPYGLETIELGAFEYCENLKSIFIPSSVTSISAYVFNGCSSLTIRCEATSKPSGWYEDGNYSWNTSGCPVYYNELETDNESKFEKRLRKIEEFLASYGFTP